METPLRGRSGGHTGTAPTVSFEQIARRTGWCRLSRLRVERLAPLGWVAHKWLFCLHGIVWKNMMKWVGAVPVCPPVSPHKGASVVKSSCVNGCGGNQACRACTFGSPGLPTIGGYPGESRGENLCHRHCTF